MKTIRNETYVRNSKLTWFTAIHLQTIKMVIFVYIYLDCGDYGQVLLGNKEEVRRLYVCLEMQCN